MIDEYGTVHSVYKNTINILLNDRIVAIQPCNLPKTPISISIECGDISLNQINIGSGGKVLFHNNNIFINNHRFDFTTSELWEAKMDKLIINSKDLDIATIRLICNLLKIYGKREGLGDIGLHLAAPYDEYLLVKQRRDDLINKALPNVQSMMDYGLGGKIDDAVDKIVELIGMGPGLTPSGDDFIIGFLSSLIQIGSNKKVIKKFSKSLRLAINNSLKKTTFISKEFLIYSCNGEFSQPFHRFYKALMDFDHKEIASSTMEFIKLGHSSGSDTLSGIISGMLLVYEMEKHFS